MKTVQLKVGIKGAQAVQVPLRKAETVDDMSTLAKGNIDVITRCFNRGWAIENQERSGARDTFREKTEAGAPQDEIVKACAEDVATYDPTVQSARGGARPRKPVTITAPASGKLTLEEFRRQLEAAGVKVNIATAGAAQPAAAPATA